MPKTKVAIALNSELLEELDELIAQRRFPNRSQAIEAAVAEKPHALGSPRRWRGSTQARRRRLPRMGMGVELTTWPEY